MLTTASAQLAQEEITQSKAWIEDITGRSCPMFCPPKGKFVSRHVEMVQAAGYAGLRTTELASLDLPRLQSGILVQPTTVQAHQHGVLAYARNAASRKAPGILWRGLLHAGPRDWVRMAQSTLSAVAAHGGVFHLWGHAWEVDGNGQWQRLDEVMALMGEHVGRIVPLTNGQLTERVRLGVGAAVAQPLAVA